MNYKNILLSAIVTLGLSMSHWAQADYSAHQGAQLLIEQMVSEHQFEKQQITAWLADATRKESIINAMSRPAEKVKPWHQYRKHFISERRINAGVTFWQKHLPTLLKAEQQFGVDPAVIVAIIGVETNYGSNTGSYRVIDALSTLAFDYYTSISKRESRRKFFTSELEHFFLLAREQGQNPLQLKGSYAGAMGWGQFMPSSYRNYAVDFDGDGFADIWNNPVDAIGSVANYFSRHGWRHGEPVATRSHADELKDDPQLNKLHKPKLSLAALSEKGYKAVTQHDPQRNALPLRFEGKYGPEFWLGFDNFYVISRYNPRTKYAMAVYQLSVQIAERRDAQHKDA